MLDASIPLRTNPVQLENPMQQMGNVLALQGGMQRNQLAGMQMREMENKLREQETIKGILADPEIGGDLGRASNALLSRGFVGPAMDIQGKLLEQRKANASIGKDEAETSLRNLGVLGGIFSQLANNPAATTDDIIGALTTARAAGVPADVVTNIAQQIPRNAQAVPQFVRGLTMATKQGMDALKAMLPTVQTQDTGGQVQILNTNPLAGPVGPMAGAQPLAKTATPGDLLTDRRTRDEGAANRGVQIRGQNLTDARAREQINQSKAPPGYRFKADGALEAIPGGPADIKAGELGAKTTARQDQLMRGAENVLAEIADAKKMVGLNTAGGFGLLANLPGTEARDLASKLTAIKANLGFDRLQEMRDNSPTGGALGSVAVQELTALQSTVASLDQLQTPGQLNKALDKIEVHYENWLNTVRAARGLPPRPNPGAPKVQAITGAAGNAPQGVDPKLWGAMTPQERALWQQ